MAKKLVHGILRQIPSGVWVLRFISLLMDISSVLATCDQWRGVLLGVVLLGIHMGKTRGLLAAMVARIAPAK